MPLLMCPNCDGSMQAVQRAGVEFDMCPKCRGVWLDRGELEKLMAMEREDAQGQAAAPSAAPFGRPQPAYAEPRRYDDNWRDGHKRHDGHKRYDHDDDYRRHGHHKKKRFDLFDIFD
ncbi:MAG: zf-TFIIB domain-containing protein [Caulobacter sp.]